MKIKDLPTNIKIKLLGSFFSRCAYSSTLPFMALFLSDISGAYFASIFLTLGTIIQFSSNFISGYLIDIFPRKKLLLFISYSEVLSAFSLLMSFITRHKFLFLISYLLYLIFSSSKSSSLKSLIQDSINSNNKKIVYSLDYFLLNFSMALGTYIGGIFYEKNKIVLFSLLLFSSLILAIIYSIFIIETSEYINIKSNNHITNFMSTYKSIIRDKNYMSVVIGSSILISFEYMISSYLSVRLKNNFSTIYPFGFQITGIEFYSYLIILNTTLIIVFSLIIGNALTHRSQKKAMLLGFIGYSIGYIFLFLTNNPLILLASMIIISFGEMIYAPIQNAEIINIIPSQKKGTYNTIYSIGMTFGNMLANMYLIIGEHLNNESISFIIMLLSIASGLLLFNGLNSKFK